jgi:hypothetical protein
VRRHRQMGKPEWKRLKDAILVAREMLFGRIFLV